ncbi:MAG: hypothetical protein IPH09_01650 [bacterium]|nr:hypothetical protein [bacterium]
MRRFGCPLPSPLIAGLLLLAGVSAAQVPVSFPYFRGGVDFHYQQWPFGPYAGDFQATGDQFEDPPGPGAFDQAVGGLFTTSQDTTTAFWYAAVLTPEQNVDLALLWVRKPGSSLPSGDYPIDVLGRTVLFAFVDGISDFTPPADPGGFDPSDWLGSVTYEHLFLAVGGTVHVGWADPRAFSGTFTGTAADAGLTVITISDGMFQLEGIEIGNESASWGEVKAIFR